MTERHRKEDKSGEFEGEMVKKNEIWIETEREGWNIQVQQVECRRKYRKEGSMIQMEGGLLLGVAGEWGSQTAILGKNSPEKQGRTPL